jgi:hypothetical protein
MRAMKARSAWALLAFATVAVTGCRELLVEAGSREGPAWNAFSGEPRGAREISMNRQWQNRHLSELVGELGPPILFMTIPGGGNPPGFAAVFGQDRASGCIDAFAFLPAPDPIIRIYHCR